MTKILTTMLAAVLVTACSESTTVSTPLAPQIVTIRVSPSQGTLGVGDSMEVRVNATAADGSPFPLTNVEWASSNIAIAIVTRIGPLTAEVRTIAAGSVLITATFESHSGQLALAVTAPESPPLDSPWLAFIWSRETGMMALTFPSGVGASQATAINDLGQVVGSVFLWDVGHLVGHLRAFVWTLEGGITDIGALTGDVDSYATAINNSGQVVGGSIDGSGHTRAFLWSASKGMIALPMPAGTEGSSAKGINASGEVAGERNGSDGGILPFRWSQEKGTEDLALIGSDSYGAATAIADNGDVVGYSGNYTYEEDITRAVLWSRDGTRRVIHACTPTFFWDYTYQCASYANAINDAGQIAGSTGSGGSSVAFRLTAAADQQDIPGMSYASSINDAGQVVGSSSSFVQQVGEVGRAFLWSPTDGSLDLGALPGKRWSVATGINNHGQVVGSSH